MFGVTIPIFVCLNFLIIDEAMSYLIERIMEISNNHLRDLPSPSGDTLQGLEDTDGIGLTPLGADISMTNGHPYQSPPPKQKSECCI